MQTPVQISPDAWYDDGTLRHQMGITEGALAAARKRGELRFSRRASRCWYRGQWVSDWLTGEALPKQAVSA